MLSAWWLGKPVRSHHFVAPALSYCGIVLIFTENQNLGGHAHKVAMGSALVFSSGVIYALYLIGAGEIVGKIDAMRFTEYAMPAPTLVCMMQFLVSHDARTLVVAAQVYWLAPVMTIVSTVLPA